MNKMSKENLKMSKENLCSFLNRIEILNTHCRQCKVDQEKFGIYPFKSGLKGECLDVYSSSRTFVYIFLGETEEGKKILEGLDNWYENCLNYRCDKAIHILESIKEYTLEFVDKKKVEIEMNDKTHEKDYF